MSATQRLLELKRLRECDEADRLRGLIELAGFSQVDVARALQIHRNAVSKWVRGASSPSLDNYHQLYQLLRQLIPELTAEHLLGW